jgi:hypothetical protein
VKLIFKEGRMVPYVSQDHQAACQYAACDKFDDQRSTVKWEDYTWITLTLKTWPRDSDLARNGSGYQMSFCTPSHLAAWAAEQ